MDGDLNPCKQERTVDTAAYAPLPAFDGIRIPPDVEARFSPSSLQMAHSIGVLPLLDQYITRLKVPTQERSELQRLEVLEQRSWIADRCDRASLEISAIAAEMDCEEEKVSQLADHLEGLENAAESRLTVAAIAVGAVGAVVTGVHLMDEDNGMDGAGIAFGIAEAVLGTMILLNNKHATLNHERNALRAVLTRTDPDRIFPVSVWNGLLQKRPAIGDRSLRQDLLARWGYDAGTIRTDTGDLDLFMGDGGRYDIDQLRERASMFDQLESSIKLIKQDLLLLVEELHALER